MNVLIPNIAVSANGHERPASILDWEFEKNRLVYITGEVNDIMAMSVCSQLRYLASKSEDDITLYINSPGGSVTAGLAVYDMMQSIPCDVVTVGTGLACSMGCFLLASGTRGKRFASANTDIMMHQPFAGVQGQATDISLVADHIMSTKLKLASILAEACGKSQQQVLNDTERDHWMSSEQALAYGLIDHIGFPDPEMEVPYDYV